MSLMEFPPELLANVVSFLAPAGPLAAYASISRSWQHAVEQHTFSSLSLETDDLQRFECFVANSYSHRRASVRRIEFTAILPSYDDVACTHFERKSDKHANNESFSAAIHRLFAALSKCDDVEKPRPITLSLRSPYSPMDKGHRDSDKTTPKVFKPEINEWATDWMQIWKYERERDALGDLWEHRYEHSYLELLNSKALPVVQRSQHFEADLIGMRHLQPAAVVNMAGCMPNLQDINWEIYDGELRFPELRQNLRAGMGEALSQLAQQGDIKMRKMRMKLMDEGPFNEMFRLPDVRGDREDGDALSVQLGRFVRGESLVRIELDGPFVMGAEFFDSKENTQKTPWPNLEEFFLTFSTHRPDGGWYFERDPSTSPRSPNPDEDHADWPADEGDSDSGSAGDSEDSFFEVDPTKPDDYDEKKELRLSGDEPSNAFRTYPNTHCEALLESMARAVATMPKIKNFAAGADLPFCKRTGGPQSFDVEYVARHVTNWKDESEQEQANPRLHWTVPQDWRMGEKLAEFWRQVMGRDGVVKYEEW